MGSGQYGGVVVAAIVAACGPGSLGAAPPEQASALKVTLKLAIGGEVAGEVLDHTDELIVLDYQGVPCAFAFDELEVASAYLAKRELLIRARGGPDRLTAEDHYRLGAYALHREHSALANREFRLAEQADGGFRDKIDQALREDRDRRMQEKAESGSTPLDAPPAPAGEPVLPGAAEAVDGLDPSDSAAVIEAYKRFGQAVQQQVKADLVLLETEHFLIWTDWPRPRREQLSDWCERMYAALAVQFGVPAGREVFLGGKCPVFCFRAKAGFLRFAQTYDNWRPSNAVGYSRTAQSGHVHLVVYLRRTSPYEIDRFAGTLVHEGVHAFLHRYRRTLNISGWVAEGLADYMAEKVLGERCLLGERAELVARQYVKRGIPVGELLRNPGMPAAHEYPVAYSLVEYLIKRNPAAFASLINDLKDGQSVEQALQRNFGGMTFRALEASWRTYVAEGT